MPEDGGAGRVVGGGTTREYVLEDDECPLAILMNHQAGVCNLQNTVVVGGGDGCCWG